MSERTPIRMMDGVRADYTVPTTGLAQTRRHGPSTPRHKTAMKSPRWNVESWHDEEQRALRRWQLDRLESPAYWPEVRLATVRALAERSASVTSSRPGCTSSSRYTASPSMTSAHGLLQASNADGEPDAGRETPTVPQPQPHVSHHSRGRHHEPTDREANVTRGNDPKRDAP